MFLTKRFCAQTIEILLIVNLSFLCAIVASLKTADLSVSLMVLFVLARPQIQNLMTPWRDYCPHHLSGSRCSWIRAGSAAESEWEQCKVRQDTAKHKAYKLYTGFKFLVRFQFLVARQRPPPETLPPSFQSDLVPPGEERRAWARYGTTRGRKIPLRWGGWQARLGNCGLGHSLGCSRRGKPCRGIHGSLGVPALPMLLITLHSTWFIVLSLLRYIKRKW